MYLRKPAVSALLITASVVALTGGCGLIDKAKGDDKDDKKDDKKNAATTAPQTPGGTGGAPATQPGGGQGTAPGTAPATGKPGGGTIDVNAKDFCNLLTPAELKGVVGGEVARTKNDATLRSCRYYGPADTPLVDVQYFTHSARLAGTPDSVLAKNDLAKFGQKITDLGPFPTLYVPGGGTYPAPTSPQVYFAKTHGDLVVEAHVSLTPFSKDLPRAQHIAVAKIVADRI
ncbi:hypothetical protein [Embleya sp. AB8]|uniref:hypothetical protein n=1 Tax=Embleya sp. AB8 TaxID=3156304 RepID=UPI003C714FBB